MISSRLSSPSGATSAGNCISAPFQKYISNSDYHFAVIELLGNLFLNDLCMQDGTICIGYEMHRQFFRSGSVSRQVDIRELVTRLLPGNQALITLQLHAHARHPPNEKPRSQEPVPGLFVGGATDLRCMPSNHDMPLIAPPCHTRVAACHDDHFTAIFSQASTHFRHDS